MNENIDKTVMLRNLLENIDKVQDDVFIVIQANAFLQGILAARDLA